MNSYFQLYGVGGGSLKKSVVVLNNADTNIFKAKVEPKAYDEDKGFTNVLVSASNWARPEKRFDVILKLMQELNEYTFIITGKIPDGTILPKNTVYHDYVESKERMAEIMNTADFFLNLSYKDAAPKVVCQARNCFLPVAYANSGGVKEIVQKGGLPILDNKRYCFEDNNFELDWYEILNVMQFMRYNCDKMKKEILVTPYEETIREYYKVIKDVTWTLVQEEGIPPAH